MIKEIINNNSNCLRLQYLTGVVILFILPINLFAQSPDKMMAEASRLWKKEKYADAEQLYYKAFNLKPDVYILNELAEYKVELEDIKGADKVWGDAIKGLNGPNVTLTPSTLVLQKNFAYQAKAVNNLKKGNPAIGVQDMIDWIKDMGDKTNGNFIEAHMVNVIPAAYYLEDFKSIAEIKRLASLYSYKRTFFIADVYLKLAEKQNAEALRMLTDAVENGAGFIFSKLWAKTLLPIAYIKNDDFKNAKVAIKDGVKGLNSEKYYSTELGMIAMNEKNYVEAVKQFNISLSPLRFLTAHIEKPNKFAAYTYRAQAYEGLKDLLSARKDYEAALVYNPEYLPALEGIARLEGKVLAQQKTDKIPPSIKLLEPAASRGLKVVSSGKDIMVKGLATDPSGLKLVTINGLPVYSKESGDFWGGVSLQDGSNRLLIVATDMADNKAEYAFEIEKQTAPIVAAPVEIIPVKEVTGKNYAVLIASQNYDDSQIPSLENPISDAVKLKLILKNSYNFSAENLITLFNPQRSDFKKKFLQLKEMIQPEDNLVIFYAGHGIWVEKEKKGYWLLTDALRNDVNTWLPNREVLDMISELPARHTLLITDACFSGSVFKSRGLGADAPAPLREMDEKISRVAITSGNDTEVPDESVFMKYLVKALSENKDKYLTAQKMFINQIIEAVMTESKTEPRYGTLELAGHVGGDFIFMKK
ncbi:hypothetical protein GZH53_15185 [Flavihumibacter sp. R14]|nr:hypothetical protein [Flavihumibacter soli]